MSDLAVLVFAATVLVLAAVVAGGRGTARRRRELAAARFAAPVAAVEIPAEPIVSEEEELRRLVEENEEVRALYDRLGFPPVLDRECRELLAELEAQVRTGIPDFEAFRAAVTEAAKSLPESRFVGQDRELLDEVLRAIDDPAAVLRVLDRDPVRSLLPVVEQIPMVRNGERVWRTPVELTLVRKRPADPDLFERLLDELERRVRGARLRRREQARTDLLDAIARARRDARRDTAYMPTALRTLGAALDAWLRGAPPDAVRRRDELEALLRGMVRVRRSGRDPHGDQLQVRRAGPSEAARAQAMRYADSPWMHAAPLTAYALTNLLDAELAALPAEERTPPSARAAVLQWVRDEVASSHFDGEETIRRLRGQEERGLFVHSLVYALLRLSRLPVAAPVSAVTEVDVK